MKFTITLNGVKIEKEIPTSWDGVKFWQFIKLAKENETSELKALSLFTGIDEQTLRKARITGLESVIAALSFIRSQITYNVPKQILGYDIPKDLGFETFGQYVDLKDELDKGKKGIELLDQFPLFIAIYTMKDYDFKKAEELAPEFLNAPCTEVMAVGNFILMKLIVSRMTTGIKSLKEGSRLRRWLLALQTWLLNTAFTVRFYFWKKRLRLTEMRSLK